MRLLKITIAFIFLFSSIKVHSSCNYAEVDSLEAHEAILMLKSCESIENGYLYEIKLGDSYFRINELANAILHYESARSLNTTDRALNENLTNAYNATFNGAKSLIIADVNSKKHFLTSPHLRDYWCALSILLILLLVYLYLSQKSKSGLGSRVFIPLIAISVLVLSITSYSLVQDKTLGIIMNNDVPVYDSTSGTTPAVSILNAGYKVEVIELTEDWAYVNLATNQKVWLDRTSIELVYKK